MLGLAKRVRAKILQASTSEVYGDPEVHPQTEDYWGRVNPIGPRSCYDEGKRCAETLFFDYWRQHRLRIKVARIFNTYGPRMRPDDGRVISNFIVQALQNKPITVYGDWRADAVILLCRRPHRRSGSPDADGRRCYRPDQSRQPGRIHDARTRQARDRTYRKPIRRSGSCLCPSMTQGSDSLISGVPSASSSGRRRIPLRDGLVKTIAYFEDLVSSGYAHPLPPNEDSLGHWRGRLYRLTLLQGIRRSRLVGRRL